MPAAEPRPRRLAQALERQRRRLPGSQETSGGRVALRQSTDPDGPALILEPAEIRAFIDGAKAGLADDLLT